MADYKKSTGTTGVMMIRDTGSIVEFWLNSYNSTTYNAALPWGGTVNGSTFSRTSNYSKGAGWVKLGSWVVSYSQTVTFRLGSTGTSGFGGPTTFSVSISRTAKPDPPSQPIVYILGYDRVYVAFTDGDNNGSAIDSRQVGWGTNSSTPSTSVSSDGSTDITDLAPGTTYYFWARTHNAYGWSSWSAKRQVNMWGGVWVKTDGIWKRAIPYVKTGGVWKQARPHVKRSGVWKATDG